MNNRKFVDNISDKQSLNVLDGTQIGTTSQIIVSLLLSDSCKKTPTFRVLRAVAFSAHAGAVVQVQQQSLQLFLALQQVVMQIRVQSNKIKKNNVMVN